MTLVTAQVMGILSISNFKTALIPGRFHLLELLERMQDGDSTRSSFRGEREARYAVSVS